MTQFVSQHPSLPSSFQGRTIHSPEGADIFVRWGGAGTVVVLVHGYAENSDSWAPLAADLMKDHTVVVPDLRGIGRSSKPETGYDKKMQAKDIRAVVTRLGFDKTVVVAHDIGNMVAYAYAAMYPDKVERLVVMDAPIPGIGPWNTILLNPGVWHFNFHGPDAERLVAGRERIYFDRIWNDFTGDPSKPDEDTRRSLCCSTCASGGSTSDRYMPLRKRQQIASRAGADEILLTGDKLGERIRALAPDGVDHIVEVAFGSNIKTDTEVLAQGGSIATYATNAPMPEIPVWQLVFVNARLFFVGSDDVPAEAKIEATRDINRALEAGWKGLDIAEIVPLDQIAHTHELVEHPVKQGRMIVAIT